MFEQITVDICVAYRLLNNTEDNMYVLRNWNFLSVTNGLL